MLEVFLTVIKNGETTVSEMSLGTIEEKYLDQLSEYLIKKCGCSEYAENKFALRVIDGCQDASGELVFLDLEKKIEVREAKELGAIRPENFDRIELPVDDPWGNISSDQYNRVANGFWVTKIYDGWNK
jgi:hypothetical protein